LPAERAQLGRRRAPYLDGVLFSAKGALYKTWFPMAQRWLGFDQAFITLHADGTFDVQCSLTGHSPNCAVGGWRKTD
jgi:4'-phosphopantetheinyl transferase EntD